MAPLLKTLGVKAESRSLTDLVSTSYTIVHELQFDGLAVFEQELNKVTAHPNGGRGTRRLSRTGESGSREIFNIVE